MDTIGGFIFSAALFCLSNGQILGPANIVFQKAEPCPDQPNNMKLSLTGRPLDRKSFGITLQLDSPYDIDENLGIEIKGASKKGTEYKPGDFLYKDDNACTGLKKLLGDDLFFDIAQRMSFKDCPIPAGYYILKDYVIDNDKFNVPHLYGEFRSEVTLTHAGDLESCLLAYYETVPKKTGW